MSLSSLSPQLPPRFGLLDTSLHRWTTFKNKIDALNKNADENVKYKVFFLSRHGEGVHNLAVEKYKEDWMDWAKLNGDDELTWGPDADITDRGKEQAQNAHNAWKVEIDAGMPIPEKLYCSPLTRAMKTNVITFNGIANTRTVVYEDCRETYGLQTWDKRRTRTYIETNFPQLDIQAGFSEDDLLWTTQRETDEHALHRAHNLLDSIFTAGDETFISITSHGGSIANFLEVVKARDYALPTGGILPVVVKGTMIQR